MIKKIIQAIQSIKHIGVLNTISLWKYSFKNIKTRKKLAYKYLSGNGIEIGGLHRPTSINPNTTKVKYVDFLDEKNLKTHYKELKNENIKIPDYVCYADNLDKIKDSTQDFVIANHLFEHLPNPIGTLIERSRVLKIGGIVFMAIPDKRKTFDKNRNRTSLEHMVLDYKNPSKERDYEHFKQFASISKSDTEEIEIEAKRLFDEQYSIHYHVFLEQDIKDIFDWINNNTDIKYEIIKTKPTEKGFGDNEFIIIAKLLNK